jgi:glucose-6-phosphate isomerase
MKPLTELITWSKLQNHAHDLAFTSIASLFEANPERQAELTLTCHHTTIDFSHQKADQETIQLLVALAEERHLKTKIDDLFTGETVNFSEDRPALHTALRSQSETPIMVNGRNIIQDVLQTRQAICNISQQIRSGQWLGYSGKRISDIVNIGIGGSDLGPKFCIHALAKYLDNTLGYHFISDADPDAFSSTVQHLNPETTLFIVSSKSFTTKETLYNTEKALAWLGLGHPHEQHVIAITANTPKATAYGIKTILSIWNWVGGRFSACSAINLITAIAIGYEQFEQMLIGANDMDKHFQHTEFHSNLPVLLALFGIWNINCLHIQSLLILTYSKYLEYFVPYVQQLDMESNGKSINNQGHSVNHQTAPIIWGGLGNQAQHSYFQLLCQGTHKVALDFITFSHHENTLINEVLLAKKHILAHGFNNKYKPNEFIPGNSPLNHIQLSQCSPRAIGELIALYEHKIYVQSVIWDINPFDQPGVEGAKCFHHDLQKTLLTTIF